MIIAGDYLACDNLSSTPVSSFQIDNRLIAAVGDKLDFIVHSHGNGPPFPSAEDMEAQICTDVPWAIICTYKGNDGVGTTEPILFGDQLPILPLLGRPFRHGVTDCYSLIRDYYRLELGITIEDFPRTWGWWKDQKDEKTGKVISKAKDLYNDYFKTAGFRKLKVGEEVEVNDILFMRVKSEKPNHAGVYIGHGRVMHHTIDRMQNGYAPHSLSREDSASRWMASELFCGAVRYGD